MQNKIKLVMDDEKILHDGIYQNRRKTPGFNYGDIRR